MVAKKPYVLDPSKLAGYLAQIEVTPPGVCPDIPPFLWREETKLQRVRQRIVTALMADIASRPWDDPWNW